MTSEQKALRACADYARLSAEIKRLTFEIGAHLGNCLDLKEARGIYPFETCLAEAYAHDEDESGRYFLTPAEQDEILSESVVLLGDWFFDLADEFGLAPGAVRPRRDRRPGRDVLLVGKR